MVAVVLHRYEVPPDAVSVAFCPLQMLWVDGVTSAVGVEFTVTLPEAVAVQLAALVTVTVYVVFAEGDIVIAAVVAELFQL